MNSFEERRQTRWPEETADVVQKARALVKYRGRDNERLFSLKMDLANAVSKYDSMPTKQ